MRYIFVGVAAAVLASSAFAHITASVKVIGKTKVGDNRLEIRLKGHDLKPLAKAKVSVVVTMIGMDHGEGKPKVTEKPGGLYTATAKFLMAGKWRVRVTAAAKGEEPFAKRYDFVVASGESVVGEHPADTEGTEVSEEMQGHGQHGGGQEQPEQHSMHQMNHEMKGRFGDWSMAREGSGTSWMPDESPMFMKSLGNVSGVDVHVMGTASVNYADAGGLRGDSQIFSNSMAMLMGRMESGGGTFGFSGMFSLDPVFNGKEGYPNLFQTGETANGQPLQDRQHPHDLIAELALSYSRPITPAMRGFVYGGIAGEPALGGPMFLHRASGMEIPEAPISHHWFDSTHISYGVLTGGISFGEKVQIEGSWFNGREPDENRYDIDELQLNSGSGRVTFNPSSNWSLQASYGFLREPEALEPGEDQHRLTASAMYSKDLGNGNYFAATGFFGRNIKDESTSDALGIEGTYFRGMTSYFARLERVEKDELVGVPKGTYTINKLVFGATHNVAQSSGLDVGVGGFIGLHSFPEELRPFYGRSPVSFGVFLRVRPSQMRMEMPMISGVSR